MNYVHTNRSNRILGITSLGPTSGPGGVMIEYAAADNGFILDSVDAPTVALELLKAAGQESVIVPKACEEVEEFGSRIECGAGPEVAVATRDTNPNWLYDRAANYVALAQYIEATASREAAEKAEAEAAEKKLQERRNALALELGAFFGTYDTGTVLSRAIDRIIELEDGASRD